MANDSEVTAITPEPPKSDRGQQPATKLQADHRALLEKLNRGALPEKPSRDKFYELRDGAYAVSSGRSAGYLDNITRATTLDQARGLAREALEHDAAVEAALDALDKLTVGEKP